MGDEPNGDDLSATMRLFLPLRMRRSNDYLVRSGSGDNQDAIKRAIWTQIELDETNEYTVVKNWV
jgi:hypothetical protein